MPIQTFLGKEGHEQSLRSGPNFTYISNVVQKNVIQGCLEQPFLTLGPTAS